jgi:membrane protease YdiL (CAAX protease family)
MENIIDSYPQISKPKNPFYDLGVLVLFVIMGMFLAQFLGLLAVLPYFDNNIEALKGAIANPGLGEKVKIPMLIIQAFSSLCAFILAPLLYHLVYEKDTLINLNLKPRISPAIILVVIVLVIMAMPFNSMVIEWNQHWVFPDFMAEFENWAQQKEKQLEDMTKNLTNLHGGGELLFGLIVFAVLPAIGEELLFRGLVQKKFKTIFNNIHIAIWVTGFIFSAIHMQFYGLVPRMLLGVMFGYLYYWSQNLIIPMIAHFVNNGFTVMMLYLRNESLIDIDIESTEGIPLNAALSSGLVVSGLLFGLYWYFQTKKGVGLPKYLKVIFE